MNLDIRIPIALLFVILGAIILGCGFTLPAEAYEKSLNININLVWGVVLVGFSGLMVLWIQVDKLGEKTRQEPPTLQPDTAPRESLV